MKKDNKSPLKEDELVALESKSIEERVDELGQEILANAFFLIDKIKKGKKVTKEEEAMQQELMSQFKMIETIYMKLKRMNRVVGEPNADFSKGLIERLRAKKIPGSIGDIVKNLPS